MVDAINLRRRGVCQANASLLLCSASHCSLGLANLCRVPVILKPHSAFFFQIYFKYLPWSKDLVLGRFLQWRFLQWRHSPIPQSSYSGIASTALHRCRARIHRYGGLPHAMSPPGCSFMHFLSHSPHCSEDRVSFIFRKFNKSAQLSNR